MYRTDHFPIWEVHLGDAADAARHLVSAASSWMVYEVQMNMYIRVAGLLVIFFSIGISSYGQVSISTLGPGGAYTQNFNGLTTTDVFVQDNVSFQGVYSFRTSGNASPNFFAAENGSSNGGGLKNFGTTGAVDRCFGSLASGATGTMYYGIRFQNDSMTTISRLEISYTGEQWRTANPNPSVLSFSYQISAGDITDLTTGTYTNFPSLDFTTPTNTTPGAPLDGNNPANRVLINAVLPVSVPPGYEIMIRWTDLDDSGNDQGVGIDDVSVIARASSTAADVSVSGRVRTVDGRGISRAMVTLTGSSFTAPITAMTNPFGYYHFDSVPSGESYVLSVRSKTHSFETSSIFVSVTDDITGIEFVADP